MATLTVTVEGSDGTTVQQYVIVRVYAYGPLGTFQGQAETNSSGVATFTVANGTYTIHADPTKDRTYEPQWLGPHNYGTLDPDLVKQVTVSGNTSVTFNLEDSTVLHGVNSDTEIVQVPWTWWIDTSNGDTPIRLLPGEERRPFSGDRTDPLWEHVLLGPFLSRADAVAAAA